MPRRASMREVKLPSAPPKLGQITDTPPSTTLPQEVDLIFFPKNEVVLFNPTYIISSFIYIYTQRYTIYTVIKDGNKSV